MKCVKQIIKKHVLHSEKIKEFRKKKQFLKCVKNLKYILKKLKNSFFP